MALATASMSGVAAPPDWVPADQEHVAESPIPLTTPGVPAHSSGNISTSAGDFEDTGGDTCADAVIIELPVGPPGEPIGITIRGDSGTATGPECDPPITTSWWEAFHIDTCATVTIDFCDSPPRPNGTQTRLASECGAGGTDCGTYIIATGFSREFCGQTGKGGVSVNDWVQFTQVPAGTYYYPVRASNTPIPEGSPYVINISAEACAGDCGDCTGACCDPTNRTCRDVLSSECTAPDEAWSFRKACCEIECRPPGEEFDSQNVDLMSWITIDEFPSPAHSANEIWGYVSPSGREYAIIGFTTGTGFVEVTDPKNPSIIEVIDGGVDRTWRDMDTIGHYAYIVSDGSGVGLQIVDLSAIDSGIVTLVNTTDLGVGYTTAHNISADPQTKFLYLAIPNLPDRNGITAIDASDPLNPVIAGIWTDAVADVRCHDLYVTSYATGSPANQLAGAGREIAFCFAENDGVKIVDVTDKANMFTLSTLTYPTNAYTHQGWLSGDKRYLFIDDELDERRSAVSETTTYVADVRDLENPVLLPSFTSGVCAIDHNLTVRGIHVFEANYASGLRVFDFSDINDIHPIAFFDSHPGHNGFVFDGAWGVFVLPSGTILVSDRQRGLFVLRLSRDVLSPGDCDADGDVDLRDFARIQGCISESGGGPISALCHCADLQGDGDIDPLDFAEFPPNMNGPIP